jgi:acetolactate synthase I/II/III large subunit
MERISDHVFNFLKEAGVGHVFVVPGGASMHLCDSLGLSGIPYTACAHEFSAGMAAMAYTQYTGKVSVCLVTNGPAALNAINACAACYLDSIPVLFISGQCRTADMPSDDRYLRSGGQQQVDVMPMLNDITVFNESIRNPEQLIFLRRAFVSMLYERKGPAWIEIPVDVQAKRCERPTDFVYRKVSFVEADTTVAIDTISKALGNSNKPMFLVGWGVIDSGEGEVLLEFLRNNNIPFMTTWRAAEFCEEDELLYVGRPGNVGQRAPNFLLQQCDLLVTIGARLDPETVAYDYANFAKNAKKIAVDIDANELFKLINTTPINYDAGTIIRALGRATFIHPDWIDWAAYCTDVYDNVSGEKGFCSKGYVNIYDVIQVLSDLAEEDDIIVPGSAGPCMYKTFQYWKVKWGQRFLFSAGLQSMGSGVAMAMGAAIASPDSRVICLIGDGGFQMAVHTLATISHLGLNIKFFVIDNGGFAAIKSMQDHYFEHRYVATTPTSGLWVPSSRIAAAAYNITALRIAEQKNLGSRIVEALEIPGPVVVSINADIDEPVLPRVRARINPDGSMTSMGIDNMWPYWGECEPVKPEPFDG